jgi:hypothetical protein
MWNSDNRLSTTEKPLQAELLSTTSIRSNLAEQANLLELLVTLNPLKMYES